MAFDPNAATARYIDSLGPAALQKAHDYTIGKEWMLLWALAVAAIVTWLIVSSGVLTGSTPNRGEAPKLARVRRRAGLFHRLGDPQPAVDSLRRYFREKTYGRTSQPLADYLGQRASDRHHRADRRPCS